MWSPALYPIKRVNWDKAKRAIETKQPNVPAASLDYVLEINDPDHVDGRRTALPACVTPAPDS